MHAYVCVHMLQQLWSMVVVHGVALVLVAAADAAACCSSCRRSSIVDYAQQYVPISCGCSGSCEVSPSFAAPSQFRPLVW